MSINEVDMSPEVVRELLGRAVDGVSTQPGSGTETVFARARQTRVRRRAALTGVAAAVAVMSVAFGPGLLPSEEAGPNVGTAQPPGEATQDAARFAKLLPTDAGEIREVDMRVEDFFWLPLRALAGSFGPYHGDYTVSRDGGVGYLKVDGVFGVHQSVGWKKPCTWRLEAARDTTNAGYVLPYDREKDCTFERLPNGDVLEFRESLDGLNALADSNKIQTWGTYLSATLYLKSGGYLQVDDTTGFTGTDSLGKPLPSLPLTKSQLRELVLSPKLLTKTKL